MVPANSENYSALERKIDFLASIASWSSSSSKRKKDWETEE